MQSLKGKIAIVTGSTQGMGKAIAERLANDDAAVVISSKHGGALTPTEVFMAWSAGADVVKVFRRAQRAAQVI